MKGFSKEKVIKEMVFFFNKSLNLFNILKMMILGDDTVAKHAKPLSTVLP